jgi:hypothetical protein
MVLRTKDGKAHAAFPQKEKIVALIHFYIRLK